MGEDSPSAQRVEGERMAIRHGAAAVLAQHHRHGQLLGQCRKRRRRTRGQDAPSRIDYRKPAARNQSRRLLDRGGIRLNAVILVGRRIDERDVARGLNRRHDIHDASFDRGHRGRRRHGDSSPARH